MHMHMLVDIDIYVMQLLVHIHLFSVRFVQIFVYIVRLWYAWFVCDRFFSDIFSSLLLGDAFSEGKLSLKAMLPNLWDAMVHGMGRSAGYIN